jgi:hypothetical protein
MFQGTTITDLMGTVDRAMLGRRYQLQNSEGATFGPVCLVLDAEAAAMNQGLADDQIDFRWCQL